MGSNKFKIESPGGEKGMKVELTGIDEVVFAVQEQEMIIGRYERFAEDVLLSCVMPEVPRYLLQRNDEPLIPVADDAHDALHKLLVRYRKMTAWFRANKIDVEAVAGGDNDSVKN